MKSPKTDKEKAYCRLFIEGHNKTQAAIRAGYSVNGAHAQGYALSKKFEQFIYQETIGDMRSSGSMALNVLITLAKNAKAQSIQLKAAMALLVYGGYKPVEKQEITINDKTEQELDQSLIQLLGKDKAKEIMKKEMH